MISSITLEKCGDNKWKAVAWIDRRVITLKYTGKPDTDQVIRDIYKTVENY